MQSKVLKQTCCMISVALALASTSAAQSQRERPRDSFDAATGRNLLNYPPHRGADIEHIRLEIDIPDMNVPKLNVRETVRFAPIAGPVQVLPLNGSLLKISSASSAGRSVKFETVESEQVVNFSFDPPVDAGQTADLVVDFFVDDPPEGLIWTLESPAWPGRPALVYSQGEAESNRYWFLSHDFPNDRTTSEVLVTVPSGYEAVSNGREVRRVRTAERTHFDFVQDRPHAAYLITLVVGKFDVVDVGTERVSMPVYVPPGKGNLVRGSFGRTADMVALYERITATPYPWAKYAQVLATNFVVGGMENTSATTLHESALLDQAAREDDDGEDLVSHELAHQWFGDLLTCKSWEHIWLNEGFATYFEHLWRQYENSGGSTALIWDVRGDRDRYLAGIWDEFQNTIEKDHVDAPYKAGMVSKQYAHPDDVFEREANPYPKGASVLHMLRERLGDKTFFMALQNYTRSFRDRSVETDQFRRVMEDASGLSLQRFFDQWCMRPGVPQVDVDVKWNDATSELVLAFSQRQLIDGDNPAFALEFPVWVRCTGEDSPRAVIANFDTREAEVRIAMPSAPTIVAINPDLTTLADLRVKQDSARWIDQLASGPTVAAKLQAAVHLERSIDGDATAITSALANAAVSRSTNPRVRERCLEALGHLGGVSEATDEHTERPCSKAAAAVLWAISRDSLPDEPHLRAALVEHLSEAASCTPDEQRAKIVAWFRDRLEHDRSPAVRAQAVKGVARLLGKDALEDARVALSQETHADTVRKAGLEALEVVGSPEALALAMKYVAPGYEHSTRSQAAKTIAKLSSHDPARVYALLSVLAEDREPSTAGAAVEALADVDDPRVRPWLEDRAEHARGRTERHQARQALDKMVKLP